MEEADRNLDICIWSKGWEGGNEARRERRKKEKTISHKENRRRK